MNTHALLQKRRTSLTLRSTTLELVIPDPHQEELDRAFRYDPENDVLVFVPKEYEIDIWEIRSPLSLVRTMIDLSQKQLMSAEHLGEIGRRVATMKGWELN